MGQLRLMQLGTGGRVTLKRCEKVTCSLTAAVADLAHLRLSIQLGGGALTDELLRLVLHVAPHEPAQDVGRIRLQADHSAERWPWEQLTVGYGDNLSEVLRLPDPASYPGPQPPVLCERERWLLAGLTEVGAWLA